MVCFLCTILTVECLLQNGIANVSSVSTRYSAPAAFYILNQLVLYEGSLRLDLSYADL